MKQENKINIAKLLKDCPKGMELNCTIWDNVVLDHIDMTRNCPIYIRIKGDGYEQLTKYGQWNHSNNAKCVIFPKGKRTWKGFIPPCKFKDGDVITLKNACGIHIFIYNHTLNEYGGYGYHVILTSMDNFKIDSFCYGRTYRLATEEEKEKLFDAIKANGYKWNAETKTLEKLVEPRFKVGDRIKAICNNNQYDIKELTDTHYTLVEVKYKFKYTEPISEDKNWELVPNKFDINTLKPFDKVLVRDGNKDKWNTNFYGFYDIKYDIKFPYECCGNSFAQCIPYEGNEHLLGTTNDCDNYYKNW